MCSIRRSVCHLACGQKVQNILALIYTKIGGVQKVFQKNVIQDVIILQNKHYKQQITIPGAVCLLSTRVHLYQLKKSSSPCRQPVKVSLLLHILDCQENATKPKTRSQVR